MYIALGIAAISFGALVIIIVNGLRKAPEAYEDQYGFHVVQGRARGSGILLRRKHVVGTEPSSEPSSLKSAKVNP
jgi:hypothetical protein